MFMTVSMWVIVHDVRTGRASCVIKCAVIQTSVACIVTAVLELCGVRRDRGMCVRNGMASVTAARHVQRVS